MRIEERQETRVSGSFRYSTLPDSYDLKHILGRYVFLESIRVSEDPVFDQIFVYEFSKSDVPARKMEVINRYGDFRTGRYSELLHKWS